MRLPEEFKDIKSAARYLLGVFLVSSIIVAIVGWPAFKASVEESVE